MKGDSEDAKKEEENQNRDVARIRCTKEQEFGHKSETFLTDL